MITSKAKGPHWHPAENSIRSLFYEDATKGSKTHCILILGHFSTEDKMFCLLYPTCRTSVAFVIACRTSSYYRMSQAELLFNRALYTCFTARPACQVALTHLGNSSEGLALVSDSRHSLPGQLAYRSLLRLFDFTVSPTHHRHTFMVHNCLLLCYEWSLPSHFCTNPMSRSQIRNKVITKPNSDFQEPPPPLSEKWHRLPSYSAHIGVSW